MKDYPKLTEAEWRGIGNQVKTVWNDLLILHELSAGKMPVEIVTNIVNSVGSLESFRNQAEERYFKDGGADPRTFYGSITE